MKTLLAGAFALILAAASSRAENWPMWRGPRLDGTSLEKNVPTTWSPTENIAWRTELPVAAMPPHRLGRQDLHRGSQPDTEDRLSCASIAGTGISSGSSRCSNRRWRENTRRTASPPARRPPMETRLLHVSRSTEVVVAAYDMDGKALWQKRPGTFHSVHGFSSTPILFEGKVIVNCDQTAMATSSRWPRTTAMKCGA